jgi:methylmalonyl-CoA mutase C-terminal domain/subunit
LENIRRGNIFPPRDRERKQMKRKPRILIGKVGLDGHDVGARVVAKSLADAGMEVVYTGLRQTPEMIVKAAVEEGVDVIGISILSGSHMTLLPEIIHFLNHYKANDIHILAGGIIPLEDIPILKQEGVKEIFLPETPTAEIVDFVRRMLSLDK